MKTDRTAWFVFAAVVGAFLLLIGAWVVFFWVASHNRVADVPLESPASAQPPAAAQPLPQVDNAGAPASQPAL